MCKLVVFFQVVLKNDLPTLADWASSQYPLCRLEVNEDIPIEKSGSHTLQVCPSINYSLSHTGSVYSLLYYLLHAINYVVGFIKMPVEKQYSRFHNYYRYRE